MKKKKILVAASVASMIDQFNMPNICLLLDMGYEVHVACNFREGNTCDAERIKKLKKRLRAMGVRYHQWDCPRGLSSGSACLKACLQVYRFIERYRFDLVHCHSPVGGALTRAAAHQAGIAVIYTAHGFHFFRGAVVKNWLLYYPVEKLLSFWTDVLITVNREDYRFARQHLNAGKVWHIPGVGIDTDRFYPASCKIGSRERSAVREKYGIPDQAYLLLSVGELNKGKNHQLLIRALAALHRDDIYCLICGQGPLQKKLIQLAERLGVGGQMRLPGYQEDMLQIFQSADIFVFPSLREGMPVALMEAMAAALPCIVSDIRGCRELIGNGTAVCREKGNTQVWNSICRSGGIRFHAKNEKELAQALTVMLADRKLMEACGRRNRERVKACSIQEVQKVMIKIYREIGQDRKCKDAL